VENPFPPSITKPTKEEYINNPPPIPQGQPQKKSPQQEHGQPKDNPYFLERLG